MLLIPCFCFYDDVCLGGDLSKKQHSDCPFSVRGRVMKDASRTKGTLTGDFD